MNKKYLVIGGFVISGDGDRHYISPQQLVRLYGVKREECVFDISDLDDDGLDVNEVRGYSKEFLDSLIKLRPSTNGKYEIRRD